MIKCKCGHVYEEDQPGVELVSRCVGCVEPPDVAASAEDDYD